MNLSRRRKFCGCAFASASNAIFINEGQGFAKVAEQIGQLALQSAKATQEIQGILTDIELEISTLVKAIESKTTEVAERANLVQNAKLNLEHVLEVCHQMNHLVESIYTATGSQAETSEAIASLIKQIAETSKYTADVSGIVSNSLQQTIEVALQLQASVGGFKTR